MYSTFDFQKIFRRIDINSYVCLFIYFYSVHFLNFGFDLIFLLPKYFHVINCIFKLLLKILIYHIDYAITVVLLSPFYCPPSCTPPPTHSPALKFMSMGHTYKFFGFHISYTILNLPQSIFYLPFVLNILCTFPPLFPFHSPTDNPPCDLHFVILFLF